VASYNFKNVGIERNSNELKTSRTFESHYGIKTPLTKGEGMLFEMSSDFRKQINDNLANLIKTNNGERLGSYNIGANIRPLLTENLAEDDFAEVVMTRIKTAVSSSMPYVELSDFEYNMGKIDIITGAAPVLITLTYSIRSVNIINKKLSVIVQPVS
jgi:phage baseplate assembly protein W